MVFDTIDIAVLSLSAFLGNVGVAVTGFGMAIIFIFTWQVAVLSGYDGELNVAVMTQTLALFVALPLVLYKANVIKHASRKMLMYFIPVTIVSTPLGQYVGENAPKVVLRAVVGVLIFLVAIFEIYQSRGSFSASLCRIRRCGSKDEKKRNGVQDETPENNKNEFKNVNCDDFHNFYKDTGEVIGKGCFGHVVKALRMESREIVAVKSIDMNGLTDEELLRLRKEVDILDHIKHPNVIRIIQVFENGGLNKRLDIVLEFMGGGDLLGYIQRVIRIPEKNALLMAKTMVQTVEFLHQNKIVHRDIKPENFLISAGRQPIIKLADFGFARKISSGERMTTSCGTVSFMAPEIINHSPYGEKVDLWSLGVTIFTMLSGCYPFAEANQVQLMQKICSGKIDFDVKLWRNVSSETKSLIKSLVTVEPSERLSATEATKHACFDFDISFMEKLAETGKNKKKEKNHKVFFIVGSQRSGSNWLRTMLDVREDVAGPHPPHMLRDFMPILSKFGDLSIAENLFILVDHLCTFVERNQVPWTTRNGLRVAFDREEIFSEAQETLRKFDEKENGLYLVAVFDAIMEAFTRMDNKETWICKSMGNSKFHYLLLKFYGRERLRYIYLVRDPRDVAMSFMKAPVGDCHYYHIIKKWTNLQSHALGILQENPELVHKIHYEELLRNKSEKVQSIYGFIGERKFGPLKREASVLFLPKTADLLNTSKQGKETRLASQRSTQFENLVRGDSFLATQFCKWRHMMEPHDIKLIESVAFETMKALGYELHIVKTSVERTTFSQAEMDEMDRLNAVAIKEMMEGLQKSNPGDFERRRFQAEVLELPPEAIPSSEKEVRQIRLWSENIHNPLEVHEFCKDFSCGTQRGNDVSMSQKLNQDRVLAIPAFVQGHGSFFSVFDGHGPEGHKCSEFAKNELPKRFRLELATGKSVSDALISAHRKVNMELINNALIDTRVSGSTATSVFFKNNTFTVSNVGDSRCILGFESTENGGKIYAARISSDQTTERADEQNRLKKCGALLMTSAERDGSSQEHEDNVLRVWAKTEEKSPGVQFTRSLGDDIAKLLGVIEEPEVLQLELHRNDKIFALVSDGVTKYLSDDAIIKIVAKFDSAQDAVTALIQEASMTWKEHNLETTYVDDISAVVIFLKDNYQVDTGSFQTFSSTGSASSTSGSELYQDIEIGTIPDMKKEKETNLVLGWSAIFWTLLAGFASGFLGGLCGIRGPPMIFYFLHPPYPVSFTKLSQRATGVSITFVNVVMRIIYYAFDDKLQFDSGDSWIYYVSIITTSLLGVFVGSKLFELLKDSKQAIRRVLAALMLLAGMSLMISAFPKL